MIGGLIAYGHLGGALGPTETVCPQVHHTPG